MKDASNVWLGQCADRWPLGRRDARSDSSQARHRPESRDRDGSRYSSAIDYADDDHWLWAVCRRLVRVRDGSAPIPAVLLTRSSEIKTVATSLYRLVCPHTHTHTHTITRCHPRLDCDWLWKLSAKGRNEAYGGTIGKLRYCPRSCGATERARWIIQTYSLAADLILDSHYGSVGLNEDPRRIVDPRNLVTRPGLKVMQRSRASEFCVFFWFQRISFVSIELRPITLRQSSSEALGRILDPLKSVACSSWKVMQQPLASEFFLVSMDSVISVLCNRYQSYCDYFFR